MESLPIPGQQVEVPAARVVPPLGPRGLCHGLPVDIISIIKENEKKGVTTMTLPGFVTGQPISGQQLGNAIFQFLPSLPGEGPPLMPRVLAKALFPQGFQPFRAAAPMPPIPIQPVPPAAAQPPAPPVPPQPTPPAPRRRVLERGTFTEWH